MINTFIIFIVMDVIESLQTVLDKVIKPMYPSISYVDVSVMGLGNLPFYRVVFKINDKIENYHADKIKYENTKNFMEEITSRLSGKFQTLSLILRKTQSKEIWDKHIL